MSHFTVYVIGDEDTIENPYRAAHEALLPFKEVGAGEPYPPDEHIKFEVYVYDEDGDYEKRLFDTEEKMNAAGYELGDTGTYGETEYVEAFRTNPQSKWDWFLIGGRFSGMLKAPGYKSAGQYSDALGWVDDEDVLVDVARAGDVDWEAMMDDATEGILDQASMARRALEENPPPVPFADLKEAASGAPREGAEASTAHDAALEAFSAQPAIEQFNGEAREWVAARYGEDYPFQFERHRMHKLLFEVQDLGLEETVRRRRRQSVCPFAILKDGEWMARGDMGWWAAVSNEDADWPDIAFEVLTGLDDDATIICCDCHV